MRPNSAGSAVITRGTGGKITTSKVFDTEMFPLGSLALAIAGGVVLLAGVVTGTIYGIMDDAH